MKQAISNDVHQGEQRLEEKADELKERVESLQREHYGGFNFGAAFFGWLVANSVSVLLVALLSALGTAVALTRLNSVQQAAAQADTIGIAGAIGLLIVLAVAYYAGGYVAGRMSRFDGGRQGFGAWLIGVVVTILLALAGVIFGANYNILHQLNLPALPVSGSSFTAGGAITLLAVLIVTVLTAIAGGKVGARYHHKVDAAGRLDNPNLNRGAFGHHFAHR